MKDRLSHAYCRTCRVFFDAAKRQCPRCYTSTSITPPAAVGTPQTPHSKRPNWINPGATP